MPVVLDGGDGHSPAPSNSRRQSRAHRAGDHKSAGINPLDRVTLLLARVQIISQDLVDEADMWIKLWTVWALPPGDNQAVPNATPSWRPSMPKRRAAARWPRFALDGALAQNQQPNPTI